MATEFTSFDMVVAALVLFGAIAGLARGFVGELVSLFAWVAGVLAVRFFHVPAKAYLQPVTGNEAGAAALALAGLFLGAFILVRVVGGMLSRSAKRSVIGPVDRLLGLGFGAGKGVIAATLLFLLAVMAAEFVTPGREPPRALAAARTAPTLAIMSRALVDFVDEARRLQGDSAGLEDPHAGLGIGPARPGGPAGGPARGRTGGKGYDESSRKELDRLLDAQEKQTPSTPI